MTSNPRLGLALALATGVCWIVGVALVGTQADTDPVGAAYDAANRALTPALVLLMAFAVWLRGALAAAGGRGLAGASALVVAAGLLLVGNVLEFWGVLLSDLPSQKIAVRLGESEHFWGSNVGWFVFFPGILALLVTAVLLVRPAGWSRGLLGLVLAIAGIASTALWAVSALAAAAAGTGFALWLLLLATHARGDDHHATPTPDRSAALSLD